jgi:spermidine/putrescine transport system substrate-binding protein
MNGRLRIIFVGMILGWIAVFMGILYIIPRIMSVAQKDTLVVAAWSDIVDTQVIREFEKETGINVTLNYYASNEELLVKLASTQGAGYDIVVPSDYILPELIARGLLRPLDHARFDFVDRLCPELRGLWCDPKNTYAMPWSWEPYILAYHMDHISPNQAHELGWDLIFNPSYPIVMVNDALEMMLMAGVYTTGNAGPYSSAQCDNIVKKLREQRPWVTAYADARGDHFLQTGQAWVVVGSSSYIMRAVMHAGHIGWLLPSDHTFVTVEHVALVASSKKQDLSYRLLNYLYSHESVRTHYRTYGTLPATCDLQDDADAGPVRDLFFQAREKFSTFLFFKPSIKRRILNQMWLAVKS